MQVPNRKRRELGLVVLAGGLSGFAQWARSQAPAQQELAKPYLEVKPYKGEAKTVRVYFSPSCPFSRQYMPFFLNLAASLPKQRIFALTPVINHKDGIGYALAYETVRLTQPQRLTEFVEMSFKAVQDQGIDTNHWSGMSQLALLAKMPDLLQKVSQRRTDIEAACVRLLDMQAQLKITNTPAVAVVGTYVVTPEFTQGNPEVFSALINGIISMSL